MNTQELKAEFCKTYFPTMLTFVNHCNIADNDFALSFLNDALPKDAQRNYSWHLEGDDCIGEKDLMLGIEEFWALTENKFGTLRNRMVSCLLGRQTWENVNIAATKMVFEILRHFGGIGVQELPNISSSIGQFANSVRLLQSLPHDVINLTPDRIYHYCSFAISTCIGLTSILRKAWDNNTPHFSVSHTRPEQFLLPKQRIAVCVNFDHFQGVLPDSLKSVSSKKMTYSMRVKKYTPFKIDVTYGLPNYLKKRIEVEQMLSYYYWNTKIEIIVPPNYEQNPLIIHLEEK